MFAFYVLNRTLCTYMEKYFYCGRDVVILKSLLFSFKFMLFLCYLISKLIKNKETSKEKRKEVNWVAFKIKKD